MLEIARDFRKQLQPSEALLWSALTMRQLRGYKFRRQQPIGSFVVDFYCDEAGLVIEVDGPIHRYQQAADRQRQELLEGLGLHVLRVPADEVSSDITTVISRIERALPAQSHPSPSGRTCPPQAEGLGVRAALARRRCAHGAASGPGSATGSRGLDGTARYSAFRSASMSGWPRISA